MLLIIYRREIDALRASLFGNGELKIIHVTANGETRRDAIKSGSRSWWK